jgi:hypothetical protein
VLDADDCVPFSEAIEREWSGRMDHGRLSVGTEISLSQRVASEMTERFCGTSSFCSMDLVLGIADDYGIGREGVV